jgi:ferredoxin
MAVWRLAIDPIACDGHGLCADVYPEGIELDDWGYPVLADGDIAPHLRARARQAVRICPKVALRLEQAVVAAGTRPPTSSLTIGPGGRGNRSRP